MFATKEGGPLFVLQKDKLLQIVGACARGAVQGIDTHSQFSHLWMLQCAGNLLGSDHTLYETEQHCGMKHKWDN